MSTDVHEIVAEQLRSVDQRYTRNRREIVQILVGSERPLSITELLAHSETLPQSSAYRNLARLEEAGVVVRVAAADEFARYELSEDLTGHHHHLICTECGDVADFTLPEPVEHALESALAEAAGLVGFAGRHHRLDVVGHCSACA